jgi:glyoxylase-like metal-dependent hydrolase (beta-lactamase superfamily II)
MTNTSIAKVHHLNCGTISPVAGKLLNKSTHFWETSFLVCHCLLLETSKGLILIDTGLGKLDIMRPEQTMGRIMNNLLRPALLDVECAIIQIERLGYQRDDVRHIVLSHMDFLQTGGLGDFPNATVHVMKKEFEAANDPQTTLEKIRYVNEHWQHNNKWILHSYSGGSWQGFNFAPVFPESEDLLLIDLPGHSRGHAGIAIKTREGWLLHCGDAVLNMAGIVTDKHYLPASFISASLECCRADRLHSEKKLHALYAKQQSSFNQSANTQDRIQFICSLDPDNYYQTRFNMPQESYGGIEPQLAFPLRQESQDKELAVSSGV